MYTRQPHFKDDVCDCVFPCLLDGFVSSLLSSDLGDHKNVLWPLLLGKSVRSRSSCRNGTACVEVHSAVLAFVLVVIVWRNVWRLYSDVKVKMRHSFSRSLTTCDANINNNNNNIYLLQLGCHPVAVVILHIYKTWNWLILNLSLEGYMRSM